MIVKRAQNLPSYRLLHTIFGARYRVTMNSKNLLLTDLECTIDDPAQAVGSYSSSLPDG